jgi:hypothetical protein
MLSPNDDLLICNGVGGKGFSSSSGGVRLMNSWKGRTVCSKPLRDELDVSVVVYGGRFRGAVGMVCSIPISDGVDEIAFRICGRRRGTLGTGSCGMSGSAQPAVSP